MELFSRSRWRLVSAQLWTNLAITLYTLSLLFCKFINTTAYHLGWNESSSPVRCHTPQRNAWPFGADKTLCQKRILFQINEAPARAREPAHLDPDEDGSSRPASQRRGSSHPSPGRWKVRRRISHWEEPHHGWCDSCTPGRWKDVVFT